MTTAPLGFTPADLTHSTPASPVTPAVDLSDFLTFRDFVTRWEKQGLGNQFTLRWLMRSRTENGLLRSGAVVELKAPGSKRVRLLVNVPKFAAWLASQSTGTPAA